MVTFFERLGNLLGDQRVVLLIDEFDGIIENFLTFPRNSVTMGEAI